MRFLFFGSKRTVSYLVLLLSSGLNVNAADASGRERMDREIRRTVAGFSGAVCLFARNIDTGESYGLRENERVRTASTIKLPIMVAVFSAVAGGRADWGETLTLRETERVSGSGVLGELSDGVALPVRDLVNLMIVVSDNTATNMLLDRFPADLVNQEMDKLGLIETRALRKVLRPVKVGQPVAASHSAAGRLEQNERFGIGVSTPKEIVLLLEKLSKGEVVSADASAKMIEILKRQQYKDGIGRRLQNLTVASKSGSLDRLRSDVGLVFAPGGRIAIAVTVDELPVIDYSDDNPGKLLIGRLAECLVVGLTR